MDSDKYRFGDYQLLEHIGSGSFGAVYKARQINGGPTDFVAIKILRPVRAERHLPSGDDVGAVKKFQQEAELQSNVQSPYIVSIDSVDSIGVSELSIDLISGIEWAVPSKTDIDINESSNGLKCAVFNPGLPSPHSIESCVKAIEDGHLPPSGEVHYMVSRYYESGNLTHGLDKLITDRRWSHDFALGIAYQIAQGLKHIHDAKPSIVHKDMKPENILLDGVIPKIADFGIAREVNTGTGIAGTGGWSAPEQMNPGSLADRRSDIYSFGQLLYWILTNEKPFNEIDLARRDASVHDLRGDIKPEVSDFVERCRKIDVEERYQDCDELLEALVRARAIQNGNPVAQTPTMVIPAAGNTLVLPGESTNPRLLSANHQTFILGFALFSIVVILADLLTGSGGWRWIEWGHWPVLGLGLFACVLSVRTSRFESAPGVGAIIVTTALVFGFWVQWTEPNLNQMTVGTLNSTVVGQPTPIPSLTQASETPLPFDTLDTSTPNEAPLPTDVPVPSSVLPVSESQTTTLIQSADWGRPGDEIEIRGNGFPPGYSLTEMTFGGLSVIPDASVEVDEGGSFSTVLVVPLLEPGAKELYVEAGDVTSIGRIYVLPSPTSLNTDPVLVLDKLWGSEGDLVLLNGSGFDGGESFEEITIGGMSVMPGSDIEVARDGSFEITLKIPSLDSGAQHITVHSGNGLDSWQVLFYVVSG